MRTFFLTLAAVGFTAGFLALFGQEKKGTQYAFLVACAQYQNGLPALDHTVKEMKEFREVLVQTGFDRGNIKFLADGEEVRFLPERSKVLKQLELLLDRVVGEEDTVLVVLNGHGLHFKGEKTSYFCPLDAKASERDTLLALEGKEGLFGKLDSCKAGRKLLLVNACRNDPKLERSMAAQKVELDKETAVEVPRGIAALFSCKPNQKSWYYDPDNPKTKGRERSLFFHHLIETWKGSYGVEGKPVTLEDVFREVRAKTAVDADDLYGEAQVPEVRRKYDGEWIVNAQVKKTNPERLEVALKSGGKLVLEFARIPRGTFTMGSPKNEKDRSEDETEHEVEITRDYWLGKTTITRGQFKAFVEDEDYQTEGEKDGKGGYGWTGETWEQKPEFTWKNPGFAQTDEHPVVLVSWNDARAFCAWVKRKTGKSVGLPTEAEWERACRGGERKGRYFFGDDEEDLAKYANVADASFRAATKKDWGIKSDDGFAFTAPVGKFRPNQYGLYDMHGNVWQWCQDWYDDKYYANSDIKDPQGPNKGNLTLRVLRGGSWGGDPGHCRAARRGRDVPAHRDDDLGFRLVFRQD